MISLELVFLQYNMSLEQASFHYHSKYKIVYYGLVKMINLEPMFLQYYRSLEQASFHYHSKYKIVYYSLVKLLARNQCFYNAIGPLYKLLSTITLNIE